MTSPIRPFSDYQYSREVEKNVADLWWTIDDNKGEITFEFHVNTKGWIALGISPGGGMKGADIGVGWVDDNGTLHFQDRFAYGFALPIIDNTTSDWIPLNGQELNGWTAIQFKRLLDTCDSMDYPIKSGTNIVIYAYGLDDPQNSEISYHQTRRGTRIVPLRSYAQPPPEDKFAKLDYFDLRLNNYIVPSNDTTYHCKVYKAPTNFSTKRHAIAYKILLDDNNADIVHHLLLHECDPSFIFDDNNLPDGVCDEIYQEIQACSANIATGWAVGGDHILEFVEEAGYPVGSYSTNKYFMIQMHYDNPKQTSNRRDNTGIRFYLSDKLRDNDLGYLTFGTTSNFYAIAIPPKVDKFIIDSYCPSSATKNIPKSGITVFISFPHTHLQGITVWTKLIRNGTAVEYLFNADAYDFNYQFANRLTKRIQLYPGDELATRCIYNTMNKDEITLGGEKTRNEMCLHFFTYYPRMDNFSACYTMNTQTSLKNMINSSAPFNDSIAQQWLIDRKWTPELSKQWQIYYDTAQRYSLVSGGGKYYTELLDGLPKYKDLETDQCQKQIITNTTNNPRTTTNKRNNGVFVHQNPFIILLFLIILTFFP